LGLGLQQYEQAFRGKEFDDRVLLRLTADDLRELCAASSCRQVADEGAQPDGIAAPASFRRILVPI